MLLGAYGLQIYNGMEDKRVEDEASEVISQLEDVYDNYLIDENTEKLNKIEIGGITYIGELIIPSLQNMTLPVIDTFSYSNLKVSVCRYYGGIGNPKMIICGHNYKSSFGQLSQLNIGSLAYFKKIDGTIYKYKCKEILVLSPDDIKGMQEGNWDLSLFTCTYGGKNRLTLRFELENEL